MNRRGIAYATVASIACLAAASVLLRQPARVVGAEPVANLAKLDARGACVDITVCDGMV